MSAGPSALALRAGRRPLQGVAFVVAAVACFAALDVATKTISAVVPVMMAVWFRYLFQAVATGVALLPARGRSLLRTRHPMLQALRGLLLMLSSVFAFMSLEHMPVGEYTAIVMLTPLLITVLAATSLRERVSAWRWVFVAGGFAGALLVIRPGGDVFDWRLLVPLGVVLSNAGYQALTSRLSRTDDAGTTHFYTGCIGTLLTSLALPFAWTQLDAWTLWAVLLMLGIFGTVGHWMLILGYVRAPAATLTPYLYLQIGFATLAGWFLFSHKPDVWTLGGIALIAACGAAGTWLTARESAGA